MSRAAVGLAGSPAMRGRRGPWSRSKRWRSSFRQCSVDVPISNDGMLIIRHISQSDVNDNLRKQHILNSHTFVSNLLLESCYSVVVDVVE